MLIVTHMTVELMHLAPRGKPLASLTQMGRLALGFADTLGGRKHLELNENPGQYHQYKKKVVCTYSYKLLCSLR